MPLEPIEITESTSANLIAKRSLDKIKQLVTEISTLRETGIPSRAAVAAQTLADGRVIAARPAVAGVSAEAINAAFGAVNCAKLDAVKAELV